MLTVSSPPGVVEAVGRAQRVTLTAYVLRAGSVLSALEAAGDRGAAVQVRLESRPFDDDGRLRAGNDAAIAELTAHHVDAAYFAGEVPLHMKAAVVDGEAFLDDRNWADDGRDTILRTTDTDDVAAVTSAIAGTPGRDGRLDTRKDGALALEARTMYSAASRTIDCESESFGFSRVYAALKTRAEHGDAVRLLVAERDLRDGGNANELKALKRLAAAGVSVRVGPDDEKICVAGDQAWAGSANASAGKPQTIDWGMRTRVPPVVAALHDRFERNWASGHGLVA